MRILMVLGTRPEAIKLAPVVSELRARGIAPVICSTGQHGALLDRAMADAGLVADHRFDPLPSLGLDAMAAAIVDRVRDVIGAVRPDWVVVQGDTTSAYAGALAAAEAGVPVAHVEAGLRSGDLSAPFPEEANRRAISALATLHFAPTGGAAAHLFEEGIAPEAVVTTGNTAVDALLDVCRTLDSGPEFRTPDIEALPPGGRIILLTGHRRENHGAALDAVATAMISIAARGDVEIVHLAHPNPALDGFRAALAESPNIRSLPPLSHAACVALMRRSFAIVTDSGGIQEEAPSLGIPLLVTRRATERPEAALIGAAEVVGTDSRDIAAALTRLLDDPAHHRAMAQVRWPFGDGRAAARIVDRLLCPPGDSTVTKAQALYAI